jgi:hypothetical protein
MGRQVIHMDGHVNSQRWKDGISGSACQQSTTVSPGCHVKSNAESWGERGLLVFPGWNVKSQLRYDNSGVLRSLERQVIRMDGHVNSQRWKDGISGLAAQESRMVSPGQHVNNQVRYLWAASFLSTPSISYLNHTFCPGLLHQLHQLHQTPPNPPNPHNPHNPHTPHTPHTPHLYLYLHSHGSAVYWMDGQTSFRYIYPLSQHSSLSNKSGIFKQFFTSFVLDYCASGQSFSSS